MNSKRSNREELSDISDSSDEDQDYLVEVKLTKNESNNSKRKHVKGDKSKKIYHSNVAKTSKAAQDESDLSSDDDGVNKAKRFKNENSNFHEFEEESGENESETSEKYDSESENEESSTNLNDAILIANSNEYEGEVSESFDSDDEVLNTSAISSNASKSSIRRFKTLLVTYEAQLENLKKDLRNTTSTKAYETSSEAKRKAQLKTEQTIADLKILHGFDINDDESVLPPKLLLEIESIQKTNDALIERVESYEKILISESESVETKARVNEIIADLDSKIKLAHNWIKLLDSGSLKEKDKIQKARQEINTTSNVKAIQDKINFLPFNSNKILFVENKQDVSKDGNAQKIGRIKIEETVSYEHLNIFNFRQVETANQTFTHPSRLLEIMDNGTYIVGGYVSNTKKFHLFIYDPIKKTKLNELLLDTKIDAIFTSKNKIAFCQRKKGKSSNDYILKIMDEKLNLVKQTNTDAVLKNVSDSQLFCILAHRRLVLFDWNLNKIKTDVAFQYSDPKQGFYLKPGGINHETRQPDPFCSKINQLFKRENKYIINYKPGGFMNLYGFMNLN